MKQFFINIALIAFAVIGIVLTSNPLFVLALLMMDSVEDHPPKRVLQAQLTANEQQLRAGAPQDHEPCMGFTADID